MRETVKDITHEIEGEERRFRIHKMDALRGSFLMKFCAEKLLPVFNAMQNIYKDIDVEQIKDEEEKKAVVEQQTNNVMAILINAISSISEEELVKFEIRCLQTVEMDTEGGWIYVMSGDKFNIGILEYDTMTVLMLCYDVIEFNLSGFFGGNSLSSLLLKPTTSQSNA